MPQETSAQTIQRASQGPTARPTAPVPSDACVGTPDAPAFKPQRALFILSLILFVVWMAVLIYWAVQLRVASTP